MPFEGLATCLLLPQENRQLAQLKAQLLELALSLLEPSIQLALPKREYVRSHLDGVLLALHVPCCRFGFRRDPPPPLLHGLHPERLGDVRDGFGQPVEGSRARIQSLPYLLPPRIEHRIDGVGGPGAERFSYFFYCRALTLPQ